MPSSPTPSRRRRAIALVAFSGLGGLAACTPYRAGGLQRSAPAGAIVVESGCLDVAAAVSDDAVAAWPVIDVQFGNRCDRSVAVDLRAIGGFGHTRTGTTVALVPYDPRAELAPLPLEARSAGGERLQYRDRRDLGLVGDDLVDVCLDLAGLGGPPSSPLPPARCFARAPSFAQAAPRELDIQTAAMAGAVAP